MVASFNTLLSYALKDLDPSVMSDEALLEGLDMDVSPEVIDAVNTAWKEKKAEYLGLQKSGMLCLKNEPCKNKHELN